MSEYISVYFFLLIGSLLCNSIVRYTLKSKIYYYLVLLRYITFTEDLYTISKLLSIINNDKINNLLNTMIKIVSFITNSIIRLNIDLLRNINYSLYISIRLISICLNIFLCIEVNSILSKPLIYNRRKMKMYIIALIILFLFNFLCFLQFKESFINSIYYIELYLFCILFYIVGFYSLRKILKGFCSGNKKELQKFENEFIVKHFLYVFIYVIVFMTEFILEMHKQTYYKNCIDFCIGMVLFIARISNNLFYNKKGIHNKGNNNNINHLINLIMDNINIEFIYCIIYGLSGIFGNNAKNIIKHDSNCICYPIQYKQLYNKNDELIEGTELDIIDEIENNANDDNISFGMNSNDSTYNINKNSYNAVIYEYNRQNFESIRKQNNITNNILKNSFNPHNNCQNISKIKKSQGKSGSFFFYSYDKQFIIKTISQSELDFLINQFNYSYQQYLSNNPDSLLSKIYGIYTILINNVSSVHIILMQNLMFCNEKYIYKIFDLKGCLRKRKTKQMLKVSKLTPLKDVDYLYTMHIKKQLISFSDAQITEINNIIAKDVSFLKFNNVMDYSLLLIIIEIPSNNNEIHEVVSLLENMYLKGNVHKSKHNKYIYIIGIIDYLQKYNAKKKIEHAYKRMLLGKEVYNTSAVEPGYYSSRFGKFMKENVFLFNN